MKEFKMKINGTDYSVTINSVEENVAEVEVNGTQYTVHLDKAMKKTAPKVTRPAVVARDTTVAAPTAAVAPPPTSGGAGGAVKSPLPGVILDIQVREGDAVKVGQKLITLEAMKMENNINSDREGKVLEIKVRKGDSVLEGADLIIIG